MMSRLYRLRRRARRMAAAAALLSTLCGAAEARGSGRTEGDPLERLNRALFAVHQVLDAALFRPIAITYVRVTPAPIRNGLHHAAVNLGEPDVAVNDLLQGRGGKALKALGRFAANSTIGVLGLFDVAKRWGLRHHDNDFGVTLARMGAGNGPYLFVPLVGPTTVRDGVGAVVDLVISPLTYARYPGDVPVGVSNAVADGLYRRADVDRDLKALSAGATDVYASLRSYYLQNRASLVSGGKIDLNALPDFDAVPPTPPSPAADPEPRAPDPKTTEPKVPDAKVPDAKVPDPKAPEAKAPEPRPQGPAAAGRGADAASVRDGSPRDGAARDVPASGRALL